MCCAVVDTGIVIPVTPAAEYNVRGCGGSPWLHVAAGTFIIAAGVPAGDRFAGYAKVLQMLAICCGRPDRHAGDVPYPREGLSVLVMEIVKLNDNTRMLG